MSDLDRIPFRLLLDRIVERARRHFRRMFLPVAVPVAAFGVLAAMLQVGWFTTLASGDIGQALPLIGGFLLLLIVVIAAYVLGFSALGVGSLDATAGRPLNMARAWRFVLDPRVLGTLVVVSALDFLSLLMCLFPALYVVPILVFVLPVMVEEDLFGFAAIRRSAELARYTPTGRWIDSAWVKTLVLLATGTVISYAVTLTVEVPFLITQQITIFRNAAGGQITDPAALMAGTLWLQVPAQILRAFATVAAWFYLTFGISLLYREIRRLREGQDLRQAIEELTAVNRDPAPRGPAFRGPAFRGPA